LTIDNTLLLLGNFFLTLLMVVLVKRRTYRSFPVFFTYQGWSLFSGILCIFAVSLEPADYMRFYVVNMALDFLLQFAVLAELGRIVAAHNHNSPPRWALIALLLLPTTLVLRSLSSWSVPAGIGELGTHVFKIQQILPVLLLAYLLALVWWSRLHSSQWPDSALHIATGLGSYFIVCLAVAIIHTHQTMGVQYRWTEEAQSGSYLGVLSYWLLKLS